MHSHLFLLEMSLLSRGSSAKLNEAAILQSYKRNLQNNLDAQHSFFIVGVQQFDFYLDTR